MLNTDDGSCFTTILGCTDSGADNYDPLANTDDGSCFTTILGCTDSGADNYDPLANTDDGSCMSSSPWDVIDTDCNMTVLLPENLDITIEDEDLSTSIWIGVTNG